MGGADILITGSAGLIGRAVAARLRAEGIGIVGLDPRAVDPAAQGDMRDADRLRAALATVDGVLHLGAMSRVVDGERDPDRCWSVNVEATRLVLDLAARSPRRPWVIYASSREVYGQQDGMPVPEDAPLQPKNIYARSKAEAERLTDAARDSGLRTAILRFSNVYGDIADHADRVVPAFARAAAVAPEQPGVLRVDGPGCTFDFTHIVDVAEGIRRVIAKMRDGVALPPVHFATGRAVSLGELATLAIHHGGPNLGMAEAPARSFDVHSFVGDPRRAEQLLGWRAATGIEAGFARLVADFRAAQARVVPAGIAIAGRVQG